MVSVAGNKGLKAKVRAKLKQGRKKKGPVVSRN